jgi:hypothetical protein
MSRLSRWLCHVNVDVLSSSCSTIIFALTTDKTITCHLGKWYWPMSSLVDTMSLIKTDEKRKLSCLAQVYFLTDNKYNNMPQTSNNFKLESFCDWNINILLRNCTTKVSSSADIIY